MDFYHYSLDVYTHCQHTFMFKHVKVNFAFNDPFNHSVLNGSEGGSLWRLLCSLEHLKTQHLLCLFGDDKLLRQEHGNGGLLLLTQGCVYANRAESVTHGWVFSLG